MAFFPFLFNTIQKRANNRNNKRFWLPGVLQGIDNPDESSGGKLLPLRGRNWSFGKIEGGTGQTIALSIVGAARSLVKPGQTVGPDMNDPYPSLAAKDAEILGLDNLFLYPKPKALSTENGYQTTIELKFNQYDDLATMGIQGHYQLDQNIEITGPEADQKEVQTITGTGTFSSTTTNTKLLADVDITVASSGSYRRLDVTIKKLDLVSATEGEKPVFATKILKIDSAEPGYEGIWLNVSNNAFNSPSASASMLQSVTDTLNQPDTLASLSQTMTSQLVNLLSSLLGQADQLPTGADDEVKNPADLYMFDRFRAALNDSNSNLYLPKLLLSIDSPKLEPLKIEKIDLGEQKVMGLPWKPNVLSKVNISGLANNLATADKMHLQEPLLNVLTTQGGLSSSAERTVDGQVIPAGPLKITADFSLTPPGGGIDPVTGNLVVNVTSSHLNITATASGDILDELIVTVKSLVVQVALSDITIVPNITSDSMMNSFGKTLVEKDQVKQQLIDQLNGQIRSNLSSISQQVTRDIVSYGTNALDN